MRARSGVSAVCATLVFVLAAGVWEARAEEPGSPPAGGAAEPEAKKSEAKKKVGVEEITVTATKREENIQDVPIAVSAFLGDDLSARGVLDLDAVQQVAPSLGVFHNVNNTGTSTMRIRGVGTTGNNAGLESAVGTFIDGVYRSRAGIALSNLLDVERIEVLRGPQGTLFGKNTSAGAVSIVTRAPQFEYGGSGSITFGNLGQRRAEAAITGPLVEELLAFRVAGAVHTRDGFYDDENSGDAFDEVDRRMLKGQLLWTPTPDLRVRTILDWQERHESCCPASYKTLDPTRSGILSGLGANQIIDWDDKSPSVGVNADPRENASDWGMSSELTWDLGETFGEFVSITAWRGFRANRLVDNDYSDAELLIPIGGSEKFDNFSEEMRLAGNAGPVDWLLGSYLYTERIRGHGQLRMGSDFNPYFTALSAFTFPAGGYPTGLGYRQDNHVNTSGWALFTHDTWHITDALSLTGGYRFSVERKNGGITINGAGTNQIVNDPACAAAPGSGSWTGSAAANAGRYAVANVFCDNASTNVENTERKTSGTAKLGYQFTPDVNAYLSFARGYKAGGINLDRAANKLLRNTAAGGAPIGLSGALLGTDAFDPEFVDSYELGLKSAFLDNRVTVNSALFWQRFRDFQLNTFVGTEFVLANVSGLDSQGIEVEAKIVPIDGVYLSLGGTYAVSRYRNKSDIDAALRDEIITHAPRFQGSGAITVEQPIPATDWTVIGSFNAAFKSEHNTGSDLNAGKIQTPYWLTNAQFGFRSPSTQWEVIAFVNNISNKAVQSVTFNTPFQFSAATGGSLSSVVIAPRLYGLTLAYSY